jgi:hypothetical protein
MTRTDDPTVAIREAALSFPEVTTGTSCNQSAFKVGNGTFLFLGPGPKGKGFKAMFKLGRSMEQARELASGSPQRFEVGSTGWVTARFSVEDPLSENIWQPWLTESYDVTRGARR